ncbi:MAG TPA: HIT family protein [Candidatus Acidoferrales bacterium]|nr:HIT family protein [Candidatus Acidoferrales bacterium]
MSTRATGKSGTSQRTCAFCQIVSGDAEARVVFEDTISIALLDNRPLFPGHCLLIPKRHYQTLADLPEEIIGPIFLNARNLAITVERTMKADGTFVAINNTVSQSVPHFHIHIVPRRHGDGLRGFFWPRRPYESENEILAVQELLSSTSK